MLRKCGWWLCLSAWVLVVAGSPKMPKESSFRRLLDQASNGPRNRRPRGISHGYSSHPYESTLKATETASEHPAYSSWTQDYWRPGFYDWNSTGVDQYGYWRTRPGASASFGGGASYQEPKRGNHPYWHHRYQYRHHQVRPATGGHVAFKKTPAKGSVQIRGFDASGKLKYKKTSFLQSPSRYNDGAYPAPHDPYAKREHPGRKTVHPLHGSQRQSLYHRYAISHQRHKVEAQGEGRGEASTASPTADGYRTTERMDDAHPEGSSPSEDYYGDARQKSDGNYYESYEEADRTTSGPEEAPYDESTTRGYYGDRIYMSAQLPLVTSDKTAVKNKYFIVRRTTDDDFETIFE